LPQNAISFCCNLRSHFAANDKRVLQQNEFAYSGKIAHVIKYHRKTKNKEHSVKKMQ